MKIDQAFKFIKSDFIRYGENPTLLNILVNIFFVKNQSFCYSFWLRLSGIEKPYCYFPRYMWRKLSKKYGIQIHPASKIGYGLYLGHGVGIIINYRTIIGNNCNVSHFVSIGSNEGQSAIIGDNVYIGPSVCIVEDVNIGDNASIGAGAVVTRDVPNNATVAGVPAKVLNYNSPGRYIEYRAEI